MDAAVLAKRNTEKRFNALLKRVEELAQQVADLQEINREIPHSDIADIVAMHWASGELVKFRALPNKPELVDCPDCCGSGFDEDDEDDEDDEHEAGDCIHCHGEGKVLQVA